MTVEFAYQDRGLTNTGPPHPSTKATFHFNSQVHHSWHTTIVLYHFGVRRVRLNRTDMFVYYM
jgi:hypothetical protein